MVSEFIDFIINIKEDRDIRILQLTDMQPIDYSQQRYDGRLDCVPFNTPFTKEIKYKNEFYYLDKAIKDNKPDLILLTGDLVYGEFDDDGSNLIELVNFLDSYKIPWAPIFGNHDNESKKGVKWQCEQFEKAKYCFFKRGTLTGNGNYTIGVYKNDKLLRVIFMMDSNGCYNARTLCYSKEYPPYNLDERVQRSAGIFPDQLDYIYATAISIEKEVGHEIKKTLCCHIAPDFVDQQAFKNGYQSDASSKNKEKYTLDKEVKAVNGDFGSKGESFFSFYSYNLFDVLKETNFDTVFVGHCHVNNISILCDNIRVTFGVKSSAFDYHTFVGSTLFKVIDENKYEIEHKYIDELR